MQQLQLSLLLLIAVACGGGESSDIPDAEAFMDAYIDELCSLELRCYGDTSPFADEAECAGAAVEAGVPSQGDGCTFDSETASLCLDEYRRSGCHDHFEEVLPESCAEVFSGECAWNEL